MLLRIFALSILALFVGCGGGDKPSDVVDDACAEGCDDGCGCGEEEDEAGGGTRGDYTPDKGTATIKGLVKFDGKRPKRRKVDMGSEKYCTGCYKDNPPLSETAIVGENGELANVYVKIKYGLRGWKFPAPEGEALLDQVQCRYEPHVIGIRVGQTLKVRNSDPIMHNVHALPVGATKDIFNLAQTQKGQEDKEKIRKEGMYVAKCEVHGWMSSYIGVSKHPFFAVTKTDGAFTIAKVPPGEYTVEAWHEKYGTTTQKITLGDGETKEITFTFKKS